jgi:hypothetical protein
MTDVMTAAERGRHLEERIASYFGSHGYDTRTNAILEGRSGGRHEIDVLAEKSDPLTTIRVAVECKAWNDPIEKDVVSKLDYVLGDLGLNKGIIVSLHGCRSGAEIAARELGIDLWGPAELDRHLGSAGLADLRTGPTVRVALGYPFASRIEAAEVLVRQQTKGRLGLRVLDEIVWLSPAWLPAYVVELGVTQATLRRRREHLTTTTLKNIYDAIGGEYLGKAPAAAPIEVDLGTISIRPALRDTQLANILRKAAERYVSVSQETAKQRHAASLDAMGIPTPCRAVDVGRSNIVHVPTYLAFLRRQGADRVVAVNAVTGQMSERLSAVLTTNIGHLRQALGTI